MSLAGRRVVVTRAAAQRGALSELLRASGAEVIELAMIEIVDSPDNETVLRQRLAEVETFDWLIVTSPNGARCVCAVASQPPQRCHVAAIGAATVAALQPFARTDFVPSTANSEAFVREFPGPPGKVLVVQGDLASSLLGDQLSARGYDVEQIVAYRTVTLTPSPAELDDLADADAVTFMSGSAVRGVMTALGERRINGAIVSVGPMTSAVLREFAVAEIHEATAPSSAALVDAVFSALE